MATKKKAAGDGEDKSKAAAKNVPPRRQTPRKAPPKSLGLEPAACAEVDRSDSALAPLIARVEAEGGVVMGAYDHEAGAGSR